MSQKALVETGLFGQGARAVRDQAGERHPVDPGAVRARAEAAPERAFVQLRKGHTGFLARSLGTAAHRCQFFQSESFSSIPVRRARVTAQANAP